MILVTHSFGPWLNVPAVHDITVDTAGQEVWLVRMLTNTVANFNIGVDIFFLMSGFLITYLLLVERQRYGRIDIGSFYMRRVLRIWPLYYFCVLMGPVLTHFYREKAVNLPMFLVFLGNFDLMNHDWGSTAINHLWSICVEEHFYLVWPVLIALVPTRYLTTAFSFVISSSFLVRLYYHFFVEYPWLKLYLNTFCRWDTLAIGSLLAYLYFYRLLAPQVPRAIRLLIYGLTFLLFINDKYGKWDDVFLVTVKRYVYISVIAFFLGNILFNPNSLIRWRGRSVFHYFGKISYGIYMYHGFIIFFIVREFPALYNRLFIVWVLLITLLVSALSYELVEKPLLRFKRHFDAFRLRRVGNAATAILA